MLVKHLKESFITWFVNYIYFSGSIPEEEEAINEFINKRDHIGNKPLLEEEKKLWSYIHSVYKYEIKTTTAL